MCFVKLREMQAKEVVLQLLLFFSINYLMFLKDGVEFVKRKKLTFICPKIKAGLRLRLYNQGS